MTADEPVAGRTYAYTRVRDELVALIAAGTYAPGALLPSVREVTARWGVSTTTARHALRELVAAGYARAEGRRGHMLVGGPDQVPSPMAFSQAGSAPRAASLLVVRSPQDFPAEGIATATGMHVSAVDVRREMPPTEVAAALRLNPSEQVIARRRVFVDTGGAPVHFRTSYLPIELADGTSLAVTEILDTPWPFTITECCDRHPATCATHTTARHPTDPEAAALDLRADSAVLVRDDVTYDVENSPLDYTRNVWPGGTTHLTGKYTIQPPQSGTTPPTT
jgi:DNA-binding GntR family transcriptional regulator